jgi:hypothetical protein
MSDEQPVAKLIRVARAAKQAQDAAAQSTKDTAAQAAGGQAASGR